MLRFLLGLIISIVGIPLLLLFLLIDFTPDIPVDVYEVTDVDLILEEELNIALEGIETGQVKFSLQQDNLNKLIYNAIIEQQDLNPNYAPGDDCDNNECKYIQFEEIEFEGQEEKLFIGVTGVWVEFSEDIISMNIAVSGHYYVDINTSLKIDIEVLDNDDTYTIGYHKVSVGNIGLPKGLVKPVVNKILDAIDVDPTEWNTEYMTIEMNKLRVNIDKEELVKYVADDEQIQAGLDLVMENQLVKLDVFEDNPRIEVYVAVDKLTADSQLPEYLVDFDVSTFDIQTELEKELNMIMVGALSGEPKINITEQLLNKMLAETIDSMLDDQMISAGDIDLNISVDGAWVEFLENELELNFQLNINGVKILMELNNSINNENGDIMFTVNGAYIGRDPGEGEDEYVVITKESILAMLGNLTIENELVDFDMTTGTIKITKESISNLIDTGATGIGVGDITLVDGMISVGIDLPQQELLDAVVEEVEEVIDSFENGIEFIDPSVPEEVAFEEKVTEIASNIDLSSGEVNITTEDVKELTELYYEMPEESQQEFIDYVQDSIDPETINNFLESFMNTTE
ncbi:hypothetical protein RJG79_00455 [Mycoplasmatota bacterium WC44]